MLQVDAIYALASRSVYVFRCHSKHACCCLQVLDPADVSNAPCESIWWVTHLHACLRGHVGDLVAARAEQYDVMRQVALHVGRKVRPASM